MTKSDKKYGDPTKVLQRVADNTGRPVEIGNEQDIGEFNDTLLSRVQEGLNYRQLYEEALEKVKAEIALKKEEKPDEKMEAEDKQPPVELVKQDSSIMADPSLPDENQVQQPNPPDQQVPDTDMKEEVKQWPKDPISEIFKGRVKQIITFQGADGQPK